jgi:N-acetylneuraminic acid mutarotase/preprotein translocase subunit SecG
VAVAAAAAINPVIAQTGEWTTRASPPDVLQESVLISLADGRVIMAGGILSAGRNTAASAEVEVYDPSHDSWAQLPPMPAPQYDATGALLADGSVLIAGGEATLSAFAGAPPVTNAVLFDPAKNTWTKLPPLPYAESGATATLLDDGRILLAGGADANSVLREAAIFDPASRRWGLTSPMRMARIGAAAVLLKSGQVLVAGGFAGPGQPLRDAELFDPKKGTWRNTGSMTSLRRSPGALALPDGRVLVIGGLGVASAEFYDPSSGSWHETTSMPISGQGQAFVLASGDVLAALINGSDRTIHSAVFKVQTADWAVGPDLLVSSTYPPSEVQLADGAVLAVGGGTVAIFENASVPPPTVAAAAAKVADSSTTTIVLATIFVLLALALGTLYLWRKRVQRAPSSGRVG